MRQDLRSHYHRVTTVCILVAAVLSTRAAPPLPPSRPAPTVPKTETEAETIGKALRDFQSDDPEVRKRAILILGKYPDPTARAALVQALTDPAATVRRNALVSMTEQTWFPLGRLGTVLNLLDDPDVHIRRITSSSIMHLASGLRAAFTPAGIHSELGNELGVDESTLRTVRDAFVDPDETVRRNMLEFAYLFPGLPGRDSLAKLLRDDTAEIRIKAVRVAADTLDAASFAEVCAPLVEDDDPAVRLRVADELAHRPHPASVELLKTLVDDAEPAVAAEAAGALLQRGGAVAPEKLERTLTSPEVDADTKIRLLFGLRNHARPGNDYDRLLKAAYESPLPRIRAAALRARAAFLPPEQRLRDAASLLEDPAQTVRNAALAMFRTNAALSLELARELLDNPHDDVRGQLVALSRKLPRNDAGELLLDLLLDADIGVRAGAILEFGRRKLPEARAILRQSLRDTDRDIRRAAVIGLLHLGDNEALETLQTFANETRNPVAIQAARQLRQELRTPLNRPNRQ
mgnify:CR=1 FL=1